MKRSNSITRVAAIAAALSALTLAFTGCGEDDPYAGENGIGEVRVEKKGMIQRAESERAEVTVRYLKPDYLASAEERERGRTISRDSLAETYGRSLSFTVTIRNKTEDLVRLPAPSADPSDHDIPGDGIDDMEATRKKFRLLCGGREMVPLVALPEARIGEGEESWFVVFPVDLRRELQGESVTVLYADPDSGEPPIRFTYDADDLLRSEQFASNR